MSSSRSNLILSVLAGGRSSHSSAQKDKTRKARSLTVVSNSEQLTEGPYCFKPLVQDCQLKLPFAQSASLVFVDMNDIQNSFVFLDLIRHVRPSAIFDTRVRPDFYIDVNLGANGVFQLFKEVSARYFDLTSLIGVDDPNDPRLCPAAFASEIITILEKDQLRYPIIIFTAGADKTHEMLNYLPQFLLRQRYGGTSALHRDVLKQANHLPGGSARRTR